MMAALSCLVFRDVRPACAVEERRVLRVLAPAEWEAEGEGDAGRQSPLPFEALGVEAQGTEAHGVEAPPVLARVLVLRTEQGPVPLLIPGTLSFEHFDDSRYAPLAGRAFDGSVFSGVITRDESIDAFLLDPNRLIGSLDP